MAVFVCLVTAAGATAGEGSVAADRPDRTAAGTAKFEPGTPGLRHGDRFVEGAVVAEARRLAERPFVPMPPLSEELADLDYDLYRRIAFKPGMALWRYLGRPFQIELAHRGFLHTEQVAVNLVQDGEVVRVAFDRNLFEYRNPLAGLPVSPDVDFAGFKLLGHLPGSLFLREVMAFIGGTYFRGVSSGQGFGTSCRAVAVDIGLPRAEEFPAFKAFYLRKPGADDTTFRLWALMDGPSVAGAFRFDVAPGAATACEVRGTLFFREVPEKFGVAPLSSMWLWGDGFGPPEPGSVADDPKWDTENDPRPEVHDSDGLLVETGWGEWLWRPYARQDYPSLSRFTMRPDPQPPTDPQGGAAGSSFTVPIHGFGLMQRDRRVDAYRDDEARYERRPSVWIEPLHGPDGPAWGPGVIELLEFPTDFEGMDNIAAWWVPDRVPVVGEPWELGWRVSFLSGEPAGHRLLKWNGRTLEKSADGGIRLTADFDAGMEGAPNFDPSAGEVTAEVDAVRGRVEDVGVERVIVPREYPAIGPGSLSAPNAGEEAAVGADPPESAPAATDGVGSGDARPDDAGESRARPTYRIHFTVHPDGDAPVELRAVLRQGESVISETWRDLCPPRL